jgi:hemerythrin-like metal-binding protein
MDAFIWDQRYMTGESLVDSEHQELVRMINSVIDPGDGQFDKNRIPEVLNRLVEYAAVHFKHEEILMADEGVDPHFLAQHTKVHQDFAAQVTQMVAEGEQNNDLEYLLNFLTTWLAQHILGMDQSMARQIRAIRSGQKASAALESEHQVSSDPATASMLEAMGALYRIISARNNALGELNRSLETQVKTRTQELSTANERLRLEQNQLRQAMQQLEVTQKKLLESEHRRSIEAKRNLERFLNQIIDGDPVPTLVIDDKHRITHWNRACEAISGLSAEKMIGTDDQWRAFYPAATPIMADLIVNGSLENSFETYYHNIFAAHYRLPMLLKQKAFSRNWWYVDAGYFLRPPPSAMAMGNHWRHRNAAGRDRTAQGPGCSAGIPRATGSTSRRKNARAGTRQPRAGKGAAGADLAVEKD